MLLMWFVPDSVTIVPCLIFHTFLHLLPSFKTQGGHDSIFVNNFVYGNECFGTGSFLEDHSDLFGNNICLVPASSRNSENSLGYNLQCSENGLVMFQNRYFTENGNATWDCGSRQLSLKEMQQRGIEIGSTVGVMPKAATIISWAKEILEGRRGCLPTYVTI